MMMQPKRKYLSGWRRPGSCPGQPAAAGLFLLVVLIAACAHPPGRSPDMNRLLPVRIGDASLSLPSEMTAEQFYVEAGSAAEPFLPYDLRMVTVYEYIDPSSSSVVMKAERFELGSALEAWGLANQMSRGGTDEKKPEKYIYFDRNLMRLTSFLPTETPQDGIESLAGRVKKSLPGADRPPDEVAILQELGSEEGSITYEPAIVMGERTLAPGLMGTIIRPSFGRATLFLVIKESKEKAGDSFQEYLVARSSGRIGVSFVLGIGDVACSLWDEGLGWLDLAKSGRYIIGLAGIKNPSDGWDVIRELLQRLG